MKLEPPALLTTMSTCPSCSIAVPTALDTASASVTSRGDHERLTAMPGDLLRRGRQAFLTARHQSQVRARLGQRHRYRLPDTAGRSGDERLPASQIEKGHRQSFHSVGSGHAAGLTRRTISPSTIRTEGSPTHRCLARSSAISFRLRHPCEAPPRLVRPQIVIKPGHQHQQRLARGRPGVELGVARAAQRRGQQDRALNRRVIAPLERQLGAERPAQQPQPRQALRGAPGDGGGYVVAFGLAAPELALAAAPLRGGAPGVEPEHGQVGEGGQAVGRLAEHVAVHHPALGGQRVQADEGGHRVAVRGLGELADQRQAVGGMQGDLLPAARAAPCWP